MKDILSLLDIRPMFYARELKPTLILLCSAVLLSVHRCFGSMEFARRFLSPDSGFVPPLFMFGTAFALLGILPLALITLVFREDPRDFGLRIGDWKLGILTIAMLFPVIAIALLYPASHTGEMRAFYPFAREAGDSFFNFIILEVPRILLFYSAWEFFFRGFMLFGLRPHVGDWMAICIQTIPQCLWHIGMPTGELLSSIAGGILFGIIALRTQSILWPFGLHVLIGIGLDLIIVVQF